MRDNKTLIALLIVVTCVSIADVSRAELLFKDNFNTKSPTLDINPDPDPGNDAIGRQTGSLATLTYNQAPPHIPGGTHDNMTQLDNPSFPNALLLAPSNTYLFETSAYAEPDYDFAVDPGAGNMMVISYDANPVHDSAGVQFANEAPIKIRFAHSLEFLLYDGGNFEFYTPDFGLLGSGDLAPTDPGGTGGDFSGFHNVRIHLITDAWTLGNSLDVRIFVDNILVDIDTDATPTLFETTVKNPLQHFIKLSGDADPDGPTGGTPQFTTHGIDNFAVSIALAPESCNYVSASDIDENCKVDNKDFGMLASAWQTSYDFIDLLEMAVDWLYDDNL